MSDKVIYRPSSYTRPTAPPASTTITLPPLALQTRARRNSLSSTKEGDQFSVAWLFVVGLIVCGATYGAVSGYIKFFESDRTYTQRFGALAAEDAAIQHVLDTEAAVRLASDMNIMGLESALSADIEQEVLTRTTQDMQLMQLLATEVAQREAAQALISSLLTSEITLREQIDNTTNYELIDLESRLTVLQAYDVYALQQFMIKMDNLTHIAERLAVDVAERTISDMALMSQDAAQLAQINTISIDLANEIAIRTAADMLEMSQIAPLLTGIYSINGYLGVNNNFNLVSDSSCGVTVGNGGTNSITLSSNLMLTLGGLAPDPSTRNIGIYAGQNVVITPNIPGHSLTIALIAIPVPANEVNYAGALVTTAAVEPGNNWEFDLAYAGSVITNFPTYNGFGWEIPLTGGVPLGTYIVRMKLHLTLQVSSFPDAIPITYGTCVGTHAQCVAFPSGNTPAKTYAFSVSSGRSAFYVATWGLTYQDMTTEITVIVNGVGYATGTGVYPVWRYTGIFGVSGAPSVTLVAVEYQVTRLH